MVFDVTASLTWLLLSAETVITDIDSTYQIQDE